MLFTVFLVFTVIIFGLVMYTLFAPLLLEVDTRYDVYRFSIVPAFSIWWAKDENFGHPEMSIFGIQKKLSLQGSQKETKEVKTGKPSNFKFSFSRFISVIKSFRVKKCFVNIDTGDMPLNGELFPAMYVLSNITGKTFQVNFIGKTEVILTIQNNAFRMLRAYINNN